MAEPICALATPPGRSAIGIIRCSGDNLFPIIEDIFQTTKGKVSLAHNHRYALHGHICENNQIVDEVILIPFRSPHSYTGEDVVEIHAHGNPIILQKIIKILLTRGIRAAQAGEFTRRAYLAGKIDLTQAEAVRAIIEARAERELQLALNLKQGSFRQEILQLRSDLLNLLADLNAELDFIEEDITFSSREEKIERIQKLTYSTLSLLKAGSQSERYRKGFEVAIIGAPNAGKSSLLNRLCGEERALVSEIPGTTRDYLESEITIDGISFTFLDTAGIRSHTNDILEKAGMERSFKKAKSADIVILLLDGSLPPQEALPQELIVFLKSPECKARVLSVINKKDILHHEMQKSLELPGTTLWLSAKTGEGIQELMDELRKAALELLPHGDALLLAAWQLELLEKLKAHLDNALEMIKANSPAELTCAEIQEAAERLAEITGEIAREDILGRIFSRFCIGK
ncbi:MAG: tRNA uridine-5-carboxymethylaminomethyl(34) synthesis GTPase MnmE [Leptospiraceae bacterium]|nr:tRNA uridine-5-carboxymethylaminomethyl(34) synthesis GTPase MnmE [Leptospiraceae bacterium]MDW8306252.1 tRNA uridine-5-carboxymethylaminomethyl(34) synthesis GTPase MnmE [Leptospiraceae bacterium]